MQAYKTVKQEATEEITEKRSRFIGCVRPIKSEEDAAAFMAQTRAKHWDASHNCHAYILRGDVRRYSDDGEPQGTAGMPILEILRRENVVDAAIIVTRYFGGTLLGAGGLARAYSRAAKLALDAAGVVVMNPCAVFSIDMPYPMYNRVNLLLQSRKIIVLESDFGANVSLKLRIRSDAYADFSYELAELSGGVIIPVTLGEEFA